MQNSILKAKKLIEETAKTPYMYATCKESYFNRIASIMEMTEVDFSVRDFMSLSFDKEGSAYLGVHDPIDLEWAKKLTDRAIALCNKHKGFYIKNFKDENE